MALLAEINRQKLKLYDQEFNKLNNKYVELLDEHKKALTIIDELKKENKKIKSTLESIFYTTNENGYSYELEQMENRSKSL
jgi:hypothetical protein